MPYLPASIESETVTITEETQWRRTTGSYYTPSDAAAILADFVLSGGENTVLEPSTGGGVFVRALEQVAREREIRVQTYGVEIDETVYRRAIADGVLDPSLSANSDFFDVDPFPVDAAVGNPPFVRLRALSARARASALDASARVLGKNMEPSGSTWMPFVLHASEFIKDGGRLAFVLPAEATHVRYAKPFWRHMAANYSMLRVTQVDERIFPEILQDVVLLFASGKGGQSDTISFESHRSRESLLVGIPETVSEISVSDTQTDSRPFSRARVSADVRLPDPSQSVVLSDVLEIRIGYVSGDKDFFHPSRAIADQFGLNDLSLLPAVASGRAIRSVGLFSSQVEPKTHLFFPQDASNSGPGDYVQHGEEQGVDQRYKCRVRDPWFKVPLGKVGELLLPVFADDPKMIVNDAKLHASNSFLTARIKPSSFQLETRQVIAGWYTSAARLELELNVHSLGGGVLVLIPGEVGRMRIPVTADSSHLEEIDALLVAGDIEAAYELGDTRVLGQQLGFSTAQIRQLQREVQVLRSRRRRSESIDSQAELAGTENFNG
jgi:adenine-specific DNA-methyltransferase